ncbi:lipopolysaccharide assembly protein LapB [Granulicella sp. S156]|jgi:tetratricopeptide (TPR) repeat protein|uniref:tetratricopeptide repeat protein n=1 Tax=Granulicella sp. S156 TaxID=1747224 RepID=UPI00131E8FED|nr:tetratricopeptide repeat protein [Granulicella sp. S156]
MRGWIFQAVSSVCVIAAFGLLEPVAFAQSTTGTATVDPLAVGKAALGKEDYASAQQFFENVLKDNPKDAEAMFLEGNAELGLKHYAEAEKMYRSVLALDPGTWSAHVNLVLLYAEQERWKDFEVERALIAEARAEHKPGLAAQGTDAIDTFYVNGQRYVVHEYDPLLGKFHTKYNFAHVDSERKADSWIACESDDVDQTSFAKAHPKEAAEGKRSFSLDSYSAIKTLPNGNLTQTHGTIKFYSDGEPSYETVRTDVIQTLSGKSGPMSSSTTNQK